MKEIHAPELAHDFRCHAGFSLSGEGNIMILVNCKTINSAVGYDCMMNPNMVRLVV